MTTTSLFERMGAAARRVARSGLAVALLGVVAACGGGGGDSGTSPLGGGSSGGGGSGGVVTPKASDLSLVLAAQSVANNGVASVQATATAVDANRNALAGIPITISVDSDAVATVSGQATDANGVVTASIGVGANRSNRTITVTAVSGTISRTATFLVYGATLSARTNPAVVRPGQTGEVEFVLTDSAKNAMINQDITVTGAGGASVTGKTGLNGEYKYSYTAPATNGALEVRASAAGTTASGNIQVQADTTTVPVPTAVVRSASVASDPSVVPINTSGTQNRVEIRALFLTDSNAPVQNVRVRFDLAGDPNSIGGSISSGSNYVYSNTGGVASTSYVPGSRFSPTDGVTVRACWSNNDFAEGTCPNQASTKLTVISEALSVSVGTDNLIGVGATNLEYVKRYLVQVNDSSGLAKADVQITPSIDLLTYMKGQWLVGADSWIQGGADPGTGLWTAGAMTVCPNEDLNRNGVNEVYSNGGVEDANRSFNRTNGRPALEPRKADVTVSFEGSSRTDVNGQVVVKVTYLKDVASWVEFNLLVSASGIAGSEGRANYRRVLPVPATEVKDLAAEPSFRRSPYGTGYGDPTAAVTLPGASTPVLLCINPD